MGRSKLKVILGTMEIGRSTLVEDAPCHKMMDFFFKRGYNELDTALMYANGNSEKIIGRYFAGKDIRTKVIVATKANPFKSLLNREEVFRQAKVSLDSLQMPWVDIFYLHAPDHKTPFEETLGAVQRLHDEGKFRELGLSNYASWEVADVYHICKKNGWVLPTVYQGMYNPFTRMVEAELFPALRHFGMRFYAFSPLAGGMLTGRYKLSDMEREQKGRFWTVGTEELTKLYRDRFWRESTFKGVELIKRTLDEVYGEDQVSLVSAALRWMNHHSYMTDKDGIILGCSKPEHLETNINACEEGSLDQKIVEAFDEVWEMDKVNCANYFR